MEINMQDISFTDLTGKLHTYKKGEITRIHVSIHPLNPRPTFIQVGGTKIPVSNGEADRVGTLWLKWEA